MKRKLDAEKFMINHQQSTVMELKPQAGKDQEHQQRDEVTVF